MRLRDLGWDRLEGRDCPSVTVPQYLAEVPALGATPIERTDPMAVRQHLLDVERAASGQYDVVFLGDSITNFWANRSARRPGDIRSRRSARRRSECPRTSPRT